MLKNAKLQLRKNDISDAENYLRWLKDPEINQFLSSDFASLTLEKEIEYIKNSAEDNSKVKFAICTENGKHIGEIALRGLDSPDNHGNLGIVIGEKDYQNKGYGTEAMKMMLDYGFDELGLHRIELIVHDDNPRAKKVYEKLGFKIEGIKRENIFRNGKYKDSYLMSILEDEWRKK